MVAIALIFIMMMFVLPAFKEVYANMGAELPDLTQLVMNLSDLFVDYGWIMIILLIASASACTNSMRNRPPSKSESML